MVIAFLLIISDFETDIYTLCLCIKDLEIKEYVIIDSSFQQMLII